MSDDADRPPGLELDGVEKRFGDHAVVRGLHLALEAGEIVSLLGPSGCGKTTALRIVAGLERPDAGSVRIDGRTVHDDTVSLPPEERRIGMVFQSYAVWPHKTVLENVAYPLGRSRDARARAEATLSLVELDGLGARTPDALSGGQQQRVALARALVARPALLLFDEPLSNLDAKLREQMRHEIRALCRQLGTTALYVTHDQPEAFAVSDRVAVMLRGVVAQVSAPRALYDAPVSLEVARFVGRLSVLEIGARTGEDRVRVGDQEIQASAANERGTLLGVRPEHVHLVAADMPGIDGEIRRATFLGDRTELVIATEYGDLRLDRIEATDARPGDRVRIAIDRGRVYASGS